MNFKHGRRARLGWDLVHLGHGNFAPWRRVMAILPFRSAEGERLRCQARESGRLLNLTAGRRSRAVILMDSGHVILAAQDAAPLRERMTGREREG
jgi:extracellular matrix regulatory protein A